MSRYTVVTLCWLDTCGRSPGIFTLPALSAPVCLSMHTSLYSNPTSRMCPCFPFLYCKLRKARERPGDETQGSKVQR